MDEKHKGEGRRQRIHKRGKKPYVVQARYKHPWLDGNPWSVWTVRSRHVSPGDRDEALTQLVKSNARHITEGSMEFRRGEP